MNRSTNRANAPGMAYILALVLVTMFVALAAALAAATGNAPRISANLAQVQGARLTAESGLGFALRVLSGLTLPGSTSDANLISNLAARLADRLNGTGNLGGAAVECDGSAITVPRIETQDGAFQMRLWRSGPSRLTLEVLGLSGGITRTVTMDLVVTSSQNTAFDYGLACRGPISISGNGKVMGKNESTEASVISTTARPVAVSVSGNAIIDGDISSVGRETSVVISGTPTIAGSQDPGVILQHIHFGTAAPVFPEVDTSVFRPVATTIVDHTTDTSRHGAVYDNVLIKAGTNPTFASDVIVNGVVFVESPNIVTFAGKVTLNGVVATEDRNDPLTSCKLSFAGQVEAFGVDVLPDLPQYAAARALTGTFIAAPGFDVSFAGQFTTINGTVAADRLTFSGQAEGTVKGSVIGLADEPASISGLVEIVIDRLNASDSPAGFTMPLVLTAEPRTYQEINTPGGS